MMFREGILNRRRELVLVTLSCVIFAVWSWANIIRGIRHRVDLITAFFSLTLGFIAFSIAFKSSFWADRIIIGTMAVVFALISVRAAPLSPTAMLAADVVKSSLWSFSALVGFAVLARSSARFPSKIPRE